MLEHIAAGTDGLLYSQGAKLIATVLVFEDCAVTDCDDCLDVERGLDSVSNELCMRYYSKPKMDALEDEKGSWRTGTGNKRRARLRL